uniref:Uncharacterized protein n=1 Tax=Magallana gigas TaxID=29159 RepID=A0A8W8MLU7_MAGGI
MAESIFQLFSSWRISNSGLADVEVKGIEESILFPSALLQELFPTSVVTTRLPLTGIKVGNKLVKIWIPENCLGYAGWLVMKMEAESSKEQPKDNKEQTSNKQKFRKYMMHLPEGRKAVKMKKETHSSMKQAPSPQTSSVGKSSELKSLVLSSNLTPHTLQHRARRLL